MKGKECTQVQSKWDWLSLNPYPNDSDFIKHCRSISALAFVELVVEEFHC